jgi:HlyD family secretion protein
MKFPVKGWLLGILGVLGGAALGVGGMVLYGRLQQAPSPRLGRPPSFGKLRPEGAGENEVAALGRLAPRGEVVDVGGLMGDRLGSLVVEEGAYVKKGALLGYLDSYGERKGEEEAITTQLAEARARLRAETAYCNSLIAEAEVGVREAKDLGPQDIKAQEAKVRLLTSELASARTDLNRLDSVTSPGAVPRQKRDQQAQLVRRYREELAAARATLAKARTGSSLKQEQAQAKLEAARAGLDRAKAAVQVESLRKNLELARVRRRRAEVRAPRDGTVLKILTRPGERVDNKPILKLGDTKAMYAVAEVYETDVLLVRRGQRARVTSRALTAALGGTVERVGRIIAKNDVLSVDPAAAADARVVEVWVRLDSSKLAGDLVSLQVDVLIDTKGK